MKSVRYFINIIFILCFIIMSAIIISPCVSYVYFRTGEKAAKELHLSDANRNFNRGFFYDPLNAEYMSRAAELYLAQAPLLKNKEAMLLKAEKIARQAYGLNPLDARNIIVLATIKANIFLADPAKYPDRLGSSISYFKESLGKDPNNFILQFDIGKNIISLWEYMDNKDRDFAMLRCRHSIKNTPRCAERIYRILWNKLHDFDVLVYITPDNTDAYNKLYAFVEKNGLWQYATKVMRLAEKNKEEENESYQEIAGRVRADYSAPKWLGVEKHSGSFYEGGNMYGPATIYTAINLLEGECIIKIQAKGTPAYGVWPYMVIELDKKEVGEAYVNSTDWKDYSFTVNRGGGVKILSVSFLNDGGEWQKGIDRNLYVGKVMVESHEP